MPLYSRGRAPYGPSQADEPAALVLHFALSLYHLVVHVGAQTCAMLSLALITLNADLMSASLMVTTLILVALFFTITLISLLDPVTHGDAMANGML